MIVLPRVIVGVLIVMMNLCLTNAMKVLLNDTMDLRMYQEARRSSRADSCLTTDNAEGSCMTRLQCLSYGGMPQGYCSTFGVCCKTNLQCNAKSKLKRTIISSPSTITNDPCIYTIEAYSSKVCQLLIEFQKFELQPPSLNDNELECGDNLSIGDFILCGSNTAQHLYVPFNVAHGVKELPLTFNLPNRWSQSNWRLVVTQLESPALPKQRSQSFMPFVNRKNLESLRTIFSSPYDDNNDWDMLAPAGCNQYFTKSSGNIRSFNFRDDGSGHYLSNINYVICIKPVPGASMIEYQALKFSMSNQIVDGMGYDSECHSTVQTAARREDYLMIPQSYLADNLNLLPTYYCGTSLQTNPSLLASAPFVIYFSSDGYTDATETGFSINYRIRNDF